jgi:nitroreductase
LRTAINPASDGADWQAQDMQLNLSANEVLTTTRSVRKRLDFDRPVEREVLLECLEIALQAPTGSNSQGWHWMFVTDPDKKLAIRDLYKKHFDEYTKYSKEFPEDDLRSEQKPRVRDSAEHLAENFHRVPVMMIPIIEGRLDNASVFQGASAWGSLLPGVWSFMLALRERGLGSAWTTLHLPAEREVAEMLGIPFERYTQGGLFPVAYTIGTDFKPAKRLPMDNIVHFDTW